MADMNDVEHKIPPAAALVTAHVPSHGLCRDVLGIIASYVRTLSEIHAMCAALDDFSAFEGLDELLIDPRPADIQTVVPLIRPPRPGRQRAAKGNQVITLSFITRLILQVPWVTVEKIVVRQCLRSSHAHLYVSMPPVTHKLVNKAKLQICSALFADHECAPRELLRLTIPGTLCNYDVKLGPVIGKHTDVRHDDHWNNVINVQSLSTVVTWNTQHHRPPVRKAGVFHGPPTVDFAVGQRLADLVFTCGGATRYRPCFAYARHKELSVALRAINAQIRAENRSLVYYYPAGAPSDSDDDTDNDEAADTSTAPARANN
jgi:hypothetical protein